MVCTGPEYVVKGCREMLYPGDRCFPRAEAGSGRERRAGWKEGKLKHTYTLRSEDGFRTEPFYNYGMIGASVAGTVVESGPESSRLSLSTDAEGESADSWDSCRYLTAEENRLQRTPGKREYVIPVFSYRT